MPSDLREFIAESDNVLQVSNRSPKFIFPSIIRESLDSEDGPIVFQKVNSISDRTFYPEVTRMVGGVYGSEKRIRQIFPSSVRDKSDAELVSFFDDCCKEKNSLFRISDTAPCHEFIIDDPENYDLSRLLPICIHDKRDKGPFITAGVQVVELSDGVMGLGIHRMYHIRENLFGCLAPPNRRVGRPYVENPTTSTPLAVCIGAPPVVVLASQAKVPHDHSKYCVANNLMESGKLELVRCLTSNILVPAYTEIVLECETVPGKTVDDTPFLEYTGTYSMRSNAFVVAVKKITMRKDAIYQTIVTGRPPQEDGYLCSIPYAAEVLRVARSLSVKVTDISVFFGNCVFDTVLCIKKESDYQVRNLIYSLLGNKYLKTVSIMDDDLHANETDWRFAFNTRFRPAEDMIVTEPMLGASLDPSARVFQTTSKVGLDLTIPDESDKIAFRRGGYSITNVLQYKNEEG